MASDIYDDPDLKPDTVFDDSVTLERIGDGVRGRVLRVERANSRYGPALKYTLFGEPRGPSNPNVGMRQVTMLARAKNLSAAMMEERPRAGDTIDVTLIELRDTAAGTAKLFDVAVEKGDPEQLAPTPRPAPPTPSPERPSVPVATEDDGADFFDQ